MTDSGKTTAINARRHGAQRPSAHRIMGLAAVAASVALTSPVQAQHLESDFWILVSAYRPTIDSKVRIDGVLPGTGTTVDLESDLGMPDKKVLPAVMAAWRFSESFRLEFEYLSLKRSATRTINKNISWDDTVYPVGVTVSGAFDTDVYRTGVGWSPIRTKTAEFGATLGLHVTRFAARVSGQGSVAGFPVKQVAEAQDALVPLPTLGIYGAYALTPAWRLTGRVDYFSLNYSPYKGSLLNAMAGVTWAFDRHWAATLGYQFVRYDLTVNKSEWEGVMNYRFSGPSLGVSYAF